MSDKNKICCKECGEIIEEYSDVYEIDNEVYCKDCLKPVEDVVGYYKKYDSNWINIDEVNTGTIYYDKDGTWSVV